MKSGEKNRSLFRGLLGLWGVLILLSACNNGSSDKHFRPVAKDTVQLIQAMLDNSTLKDSIFSRQISQNLIVHKDQHIPISASFTYKSRLATIQETKFKPSDIDIDHPRFLIAIGKCEIKDSLAVLEFIMPDVGLGISTTWTRNKTTEPWALSKWNDEQY